MPKDKINPNYEVIRFSTRILLAKGKDIPDKSCAELLFRALYCRNKKTSK